MKLTEMSNEVYSYVCENGKVSVEELAEKFNRTTRSIRASVLDLTKKKLCVTEKVAGEEKDITFVVKADGADEAFAALPERK